MECSSRAAAGSLSPPGAKAKVSARGHSTAPKIRAGRVPPPTKAPDVPQSNTKRTQPTLQSISIVGVIALIVVAIAVWAALDGGTRAQPDFYATTAQVIPVLILAFIVEKTPWEAWNRGYRVIVVVALVLGESAALTAAALAEQTDPGGQYLVAASRLLTDLLVAVIVLSLGVCLVAVLSPLAERTES